MTMRIRKYRQGDEPAAYYICMKTGDHGKDGEPFFKDDPDALGRIYVGPYLRFAPEFAFMLEDDAGVCGYALGALDSRTFYQKYDNHWRPKLVKEFPAPTGAPAKWTLLESVYHLYHHPDYFFPDPYDKFPSHLHVDLLPRAQGHGFGRLIVGKVIESLRNHGAVGVHLGMSVVNNSAYGFYKKLGFEELMRDDDSLYMGMAI